MRKSSSGAAAGEARGEKEMEGAGRGRQANFTIVGSYLSKVRSMLRIRLGERRSRGNRADWNLLLKGSLTNHLEKGYRKKGVRPDLTSTINKREPKGG